MVRRRGGDSHKEKLSRKVSMGLDSRQSSRQVGI